MNNLRLTAARIINQVTEGRSLTDCLEPALSAIKDSRDRAFVQALCFGVCRFYVRLDVVLSFLLEKPMKAKDSDVHSLLLVGLYQLMEMRVPPHAAVTETVNATEPLKKPWARGLTNAVLREYLRNQEKIEADWQADEEALYAHPVWWIEAIKKTWPDYWQTILTKNNEHPPFALRVNQRHLTREQYITILQTHDLAAKIIPETQQGIILETPIAVENLPGFAAGDVSVQDGAAQIAAELLELAPGLRVLDACAAPGGKLCHILEIEPNLAAVVAVEKDVKRMRIIKENLERLKLHAECICCDVLEIKSKWDGQLFDRILLDAPCSASGVVRRHPDIKLLRRESDIEELAKTQLNLLESLWPLLKSGGLLLYITCSIFPAENVQVVQQFLNDHPEAKEDKIHHICGLDLEIGRQILPGLEEMDGFYYARIKKIA